MIRNHLKIAFRNFRRQRGYAGINVAGLAVGMACCLLLFMYVRNELAVNEVFQDVDRLYRVDSRWADASAGLPVTTVAPAGTTLEQEYPDVVNQVRLYLMSGVVRTDRESFRKEIMMADPSVLDIFDLPLLAGDAERALLEPRSAVITEELALTLFGTTDALGETIMLETWNRGDQPFTVTGVRENLPYNSVTYFGTESGEYDVIIPPEPFGDFIAEEGWTSWESRYLMQFVKLAPGASAATFQDQIDGFIERHAPEAFHGELTIALNPLSALHLSDNGGEGWRTIRLLSMIAVLVLLIACINYMNLATARSMTRAREVGVRKALGARRAELVRQFLSESMVLCFGAALLAVILAELFREPLFALTGSEATLTSYWDAYTFCGLASIAVLTGILAGSYPAFYLSALKPSQIMKGAEPTGRSSLRLRHGLVILQFAAAIVLLISVYAVSEQLSFAMEHDLGFERENVMVIDTVPREFDAEGLAQMETLKTQLQALPGVMSASLSWHLPIGEGTGGSTRRISDPSWDEGRYITPDFLVVDSAFAETYDLNVVSGRFFSPERPADAEGLILNESAVEALGWDDVEGKSVIFESGESAPVIGVIEDYHLFGVRHAIRPVALVSVEANMRYRMLSLRLTPQNIRQTIAEVERSWQEVLPGAPFEYTFLDERISQLYSAEQRARYALIAAALLALGIACLGMLGLAAFTAQQRTKEIGVRKALGASMPNILALLSKDFLRLVLVAFVIAAPIAYFAINRWLENFAYRIELGASVFIIAGLLALGVALLTVSYHALRAALTDPAKSLRYE